METFILGTFKWFAQFKVPEQDQVLADFQTPWVRPTLASLPRQRSIGSCAARTTLTLAYSLNDVLFVAHVGDSRCYLCRHGILYKLTRDHTLVDEMVRRGALAAEEAGGATLRHVITNAVGGGSADVNVEVHKLQWKAATACCSVPTG